MKITCPECNTTLPAENIALDAGWAKCSRCNEVFQLAALLPGYAPGGAAAPPERPFDAWAVLERTPDKLRIHIPPQGMRAGTWAGLLFALFWTGFVAFWTAGALGVFFNNGQIQWENLLFACFSIPFWLVGLGMLGGTLWMARGSRTVLVSPSHLVTELRCLFWRRRRVRDRSTVQHAREGTYTVKSNDSTPTPYSVEIIFTKGSFRVPCNSEAERAWLLWEINDFLKNTPYRPDAVFDPTDEFGCPRDIEWRRLGEETP